MIGLRLRKFYELKMFTVALLEPQIPPNTGNIARTCAANNLDLVVVGQLGFELSDKYLKRAGLDYWEFSRIRYEPDLEKYLANLNMSHVYLLTTKGTKLYTAIKPQRGDTFVFGNEIWGFSKGLLKQHSESCYTIPMINKNIRCLNLATSVGIVMYHMLALYNFGLR